MQTTNDSPIVAKHLDRIKKKSAAATKLALSGQHSRALSLVRSALQDVCDGDDPRVTPLLSGLRSSIEAKFIKKGEKLCPRCDGTGVYPYYSKSKQRAVVGRCLTCDGDGKYVPKKGESHYKGF